MTSNCITHQEIARVLHADGSEYKMGTLVYGTYEEIEDWCEKNDMWVDKYLDHVNPSTTLPSASTLKLFCGAPSLNSFMFNNGFPFIILLLFIISDLNFLVNKILIS